MGRAPCCSKVGLHRGPWTSREDALLTSYIHTNGEGSWRSLPKKAGLLRCGKSCRLRWMNYLRPDIKRGNIAPEEEDLIIRLHRLLGNRWSLIAGRLPGRTDNEIKNYWNSHLSKKLRMQGFVLREAAPRGKQSKASKQNSCSNSSHRECGKIFAPKPTRLAARIATEKGTPDHDENSIREDEVSANDWSDAGEIDMAGDYPGFLESNCRRFGFDDEISFPVQQETVMLERLYEEYSQLLQSEGDRNLFDHQFLMV